jgi:YD repeat-containing protein
MSRSKVWLISSAGVAAALGNAALAQETTSYNYDALGRLTGSSISGGPNSSRTTGTCFDAAGNRMRYDVATATPANCPTPTPTPTPT